MLPASVQCPKESLKLIYRSAMGFMDEALPPETTAQIAEILARYEKKGIRYHGLLTRQAGMRRFISLHLLVPGKKTIREGHDIAEEIEKRIIALHTPTTVITHIEPVEDRKSLEDIPLDR